MDATQGKTLREPSKEARPACQAAIGDGRRHSAADPGVGGNAQWGTTDSSARWCWHRERGTGDTIGEDGLTLQPGNLNDR
ncbi:hypothetical protein E2C01_069332 [Portunus trituberculatus]|uniref:Uncharacterized protein n=1 Tax=Portunus trituberculatus TaxID=210409 RepID=A0A5B7HZ26_PORTR|nr:hypothetical protein [Portunus trituberculatus]